MQNNKNDDEPNIWITVAKLFIGAVILIGGTGFLLWYASEMQEDAEIQAPKTQGGVNWGIAGDSPLRR